MSIQIQIASRVDRKAVMFDRLSTQRINKKIGMFREMELEELLKRSHSLRAVGEAQALWVTEVSPALRMIFRRTGPDSIELIDVVAHDDLNKFVASPI